MSVLLVIYKIKPFITHNSPLSAIAYIIRVYCVLSFTKLKQDQNEVRPMYLL